MASTKDRGLHMSAKEFIELVDFVNSVSGEDTSQMNALIETYRAMHRTAIKSRERLIVANVVIMMGVVAVHTQRHTVPLYITQWFLYKVSTGSEENDILMRENMNVMTLMDLLHYLNGGEDKQLETITPDIAELVSTIEVPFRNFLEQLQIAASFDLFDKRYRRGIGSLL